MFIEQTLWPRNPQRKSACGGRFFYATSRTVENGPSLFTEIAIHTNNSFLIDAAKIYPNFGAAARFVQTALADADGSHRFVVRQHGKHHFTRLGDCFR